MSRTVLGHTPLHAAAMSGCPISAKLLIEGGANLRQRTQHGETPILSACRCSNEGGAETFKVLLDALKKDAKEDYLVNILNNMINMKKRRAIDIAARR